MILLVELRRIIVPRKKRENAFWRNKRLGRLSQQKPKNGNGGSHSNEQVISELKICGG